MRNKIYLHQQIATQIATQKHSNLLKLQVLNETHLQIMSEMAVTVFEILERAWAQQDCSLVDMKVAHSVNYVM